MKLKFEQAPKEYILIDGKFYKFNANIWAYELCKKYLKQAE